LVVDKYRSEHTVTANGMLACLVGEFKVTLFGSSSKDDERKKAKIATQPQLGKLAVSTSLNIYTN